MGSVGQGFPARLGSAFRAKSTTGSAFRAKSTTESACSGLVEPGISRSLLYTLTYTASSNQGGSPCQRHSPSKPEPVRCGAVGRLPLTGNSSGFFRPLPHNSSAPQRSSPHSPGLSCRDCLRSSKPMSSEAARKGPPSKREADLPTSHSPAVRSIFSVLGALRRP